MGREFKKPKLMRGVVESMVSNLLFFLLELIHQWFMDQVGFELDIILNLTIHFLIWQREKQRMFLHILIRLVGFKMLEHVFGWNKVDFKSIFFLTSITKMNLGLIWLLLLCFLVFLTRFNLRFKQSRKFFLKNIQFFEKLLFINFLKLLKKNLVFVYHFSDFELFLILSFLKMYSTA